MHPELISLPGGLSIKTYGFCLMVGFLSAVWLAMRRADRVKASSDCVLDISFLCLLFGVGGARALYVIHYWKPQFADAPNRLLAVINITSGGLEFLGGFLGAVIATVIYAKLKKRSLRLYLDIMAPGAMWGLAFGRVGCFFNGCCFGGLCALASAAEPVHPWAVEFPFASPAQWRHWEDRLVTVPAELITTTPGSLSPVLVPDSLLSMSVEKREGPGRRAREARDVYEQAKAASVGDEELERLKQAAQEALKRAKAHEDKTLVQLRAAQRFASRVEPTRVTSVSELQDLAAHTRSLPVHPTQLYAAGTAMFLSLFLSAIFYRRKRHGVVIGALFVLYPLQRTLLELIRADNPHDVAGLTISQSVSLPLFVLGAVYLYILYKYMPQRSPYAVAAPPPDAK